MLRNATQETPSLLHRNTYKLLRIYLQYSQEEQSVSSPILNLDLQVTAHRHSSGGRKLPCIPGQTFPLYSSLSSYLPYFPVGTSPGFGCPTLSRSS